MSRTHTVTRRDEYDLTCITAKMCVLIDELVEDCNCNRPVWRRRRSAAVHGQSIAAAAYRAPNSLDDYYFAKLTYNSYHSSPS